MDTMSDTTYSFNMVIGKPMDYKRLFRSIPDQISPGDIIMVSNQFDENLFGFTTTQAVSV